MNYHSYKSKYCVQWKRKHSCNSHETELLQGKPEQKETFLRYHWSKCKRGQNLAVFPEVCTYAGETPPRTVLDNEGVFLLFCCWFCFVTQAGLQLTSSRGWLWTSGLPVSSSRCILTQAVLWVLGILGFLQDRQTLYILRHILSQCFPSRSP